MKNKLIALSFALTGLSSLAMAAPVIQTCASMEVTHNSNVGLSYSLSCAAGDWNLKYTGSIPAGNEPVAAQYRLDVSRPDGSSFTMNRTVNTPAPAHLGRMLVREAVLLDSGELALRDCKEFACTLYRPVGFKGNLAKSTITVPPAVKRLTDERAALAETLKQREATLAEQAAKLDQQAQTVSALERQLAEAQAQVAKATADHTAALSAAQAARDAEKQQQQEQASRDVAGAVKAGEAAQAAALEKANSEWSSKLAATEAELKAAQESVNSLTAQVIASQDAMAKQEAMYKEVTAGLEKANAAASGELAKTREQLAAATKVAEAVKAYEFAIKDLVEQHNAQLAAVRQALPDTNFNGLLQDLSIPTVVGLPQEVPAPAVAQAAPSPKAAAKPAAAPAKKVTTVKPPKSVKVAR